MNLKKPMGDEITGLEPALSQGITGNEPQLGGPLGDGLSWEQLTRDECHATALKICQKHDFCLEEIGQDLIGSGLLVRDIVNFGGIVHLCIQDGNELLEFYITRLIYHPQCRCYPVPQFDNGV